MIEIKILQERDLTAKETEKLFDEIMNGKFNEEEIYSFLNALTEKGESSKEIFGALNSISKAMISVKSSIYPLIDTCGTGGDKSNSFNISTAAAITAASAGCFIAKHGNTAASSKSGSADVLEELGINLNLSPKQEKQVLEKIGISFLFAKAHHPSMKFVANARKKINKRTIFNILGPLSNPANASRRLLGVSNPELIPVVSEALAMQKIEHALVVHGNKMDELNLFQNNIVFEIKEKKIKRYLIDAKELGLNYAENSEFIVSDSKESAKVIQEIFSGKEKGPKKDIVVLNSAAAIYLSGKTNSIKEAVPIAKECIESGKAKEKLSEMIKATNELSD
ncbi:MAG: anthranilate phosphoribosyltransferase [Candidatus Diapherotrites archaeon]